MWFEVCEVRRYYSGRVEVVNSKLRSELHEQCQTALSSPTLKIRAEPVYNTQNDCRTFEDYRRQIAHDGARDELKAIRMCN